MKSLIRKEVEAILTKDNIVRMQRVVKTRKIVFTLVANENWNELKEPIEKIEGLKRWKTVAFTAEEISGIVFVRNAKLILYF